MRVFSSGWTMCSDTTRRSVISFDVDCYVIHNCIHIYLSMAWRIISLDCIPLCLLRYVKNVSLYFPRSRVSSTYPVSTTFFSSFLRITCPRNVICLRIMSRMSPFPTPALWNTSHILTLSVQGMLNILLRNQCSAASKFFHHPFSQCQCFTYV